MTKPTHHIFVCGSFRATGAQCVCHKKESAQLLPYFEQEANDRGLDGVMVLSTGCLKGCDHGPIVIVQPQNARYKGVNEAVADAILDANVPARERGGGCRAGAAPRISRPQRSRDGHREDHRRLRGRCRIGANASPSSAAVRRASIRPSNSARPAARSSPMPCSPSKRSTSSRKMSSRRSPRLRTPVPP